VPELPEIEVLRRSLEPRLVGRRVERVEVRVPALREPLDRRRLGALAGRRIERLRRRSKYLWIDFDADRTLVVHLGMSGRLTLVAAGEPREAHEHLALSLDGGERLRLRDPRRFGVAFVAATGRLAADRHFAALGREPLGEPLTGEDLAALATGRRGPVKSFLMDAGRLVGVGNIYASEALHRAGVRPDRSVARLSAASWGRVAESVVAVLEQAIREGGTTLNDFADGGGNEGYFQVSLAVYGRDGESCLRCDGTIRRIVQSGRGSYFCPRCQH
jgi:formamidopyrimidine-DNA glycosylase